MRKVLPFFLGIFLVVVVGAYWVLNYTGSNKDLATGSPYLITVEPGMTTADIANLLHKQKLVKTPEAFRLEAKFRGLERDLQAGRYEITAGMSNSEIVEVLSKGQVQRVRFTVPEGFTVVKTAKKKLRLKVLVLLKSSSKPRVIILHIPIWKPVILMLFIRRKDLFFPLPICLTSV